MIWLIARKDFFLNLISARFVIGFILCLVVIPFTIMVGVDRYKDQVRVHKVYEQNMENAKKEIRVYSQVRPEIIIPPEPLSIFSRGISDNIGNSITIQLGEYPLFPSGHTVTRDNPLLNTFFSIDFATVIAILISLLALVFSYDIFTREREDGTLKITLVNGVGRPAFLMGKLLGIFITLVPILLFCFLLGILVTVLSPDVEFSADNWVGVGLLFLSSLIYMSVFILFGMFISTKAKHSSTSIIVSLLCWIWFLFLMPNIASYISQSFVKTEVYDNVQFALNALDRESRNEYNEKADPIKRDLGIDGGISHWNYNGWYDGMEIMSGCTWETNEYYRRINTWKEPTRIDYADKKWAVQKKYLDDLERQGKIREYLACLSPAGIFEQVADIQCNTDPVTFLGYMDNVRNYRESIISYFKDKKLFESYSYFTPQPESTFPTQEQQTLVLDGFRNTGKYESPEEWNIQYYPPLNLDDVPVFEHKKATVISAVNASLVRIAGLIALCTILLGITIVSFVRYDIR